MDEDNFQFELDGRQYVMSNGELTIDDCGYEEQADDPTYSLVRFAWRMLVSNPNLVIKK